MRPMGPVDEEFLPHPYEEEHMTEPFEPFVPDQAEELESEPELPPAAGL
jgi:hypothetical protein